MSSIRKSIAKTQAENYCMEDQIKQIESDFNKSNRITNWCIVGAVILCVALIIFELTILS